MRRLAIWFVLVAVLGLMLGTGQAWAQATSTATTAVGPTAVPTPTPISQLTPLILVESPSRVRSLGRASSP